MKTGKVTKKSNEGSTNQKMFIDSSATFFSFFVSKYNHIKASRDVIGKEAIKPPQKEVFLLTSETITSKVADMAILIMYLSIYSLPF